MPTLQGLIIARKAISRYEPESDMEMFVKGQLLMEFSQSIQAEKEKAQKQSEDEVVVKPPKENDE